MCGIAGYLAPRCRADAEIISAMARALQHRGPDDDGYWVDSSAGISMGFQRLSVVDLTALGHQPMVSPDGRFVIVFNGEAYNFRELRQRLEGLGHRFLGASDTEVVLAACMQWGPTEAPRYLEGMFAFAIWDRRDRKLTLCRDRLGIKPLYYGNAGRALVFASELKAIAVHPWFESRIDAQALATYSAYGYVPTPLSIYENIRKLEPGTTVSSANEDWDGPISYWSAEESFSLTEDVRALPELRDELEALLRQSVARQMVADVPVGALLSGGVDSSVVTAIMTRCGPGKVKTFSIGFEDPEYDEGGRAAAVATVLGADHTAITMTSKDAIDAVLRLPATYDEPFGDSSQLPTALVANAARRCVTVVLTGDGGDEMFGGYQRYRYLSRIQRLGTSPAAGLLRCALWSTGRLMRSGTEPAGRLMKAATALGARDLAAAYDRVCQSGTAHHRQLTHPRLANRPTLPGRDDITRMQCWDSLTYLTDDVLTKVDRATMACSLEARVPLLDERLLAFAARLPRHAKCSRGIGKTLLRQVLAKMEPAAIAHTQKKGFAVPIADWLAGPLRDWAESLLSNRALANSGWIETEEVRRDWSSVLAGRDHAQSRVWIALMYVAWHQQWIGSRVAIASPA